MGGEPAGSRTPAADGLFPRPGAGGGPHRNTDGGGWWRFAVPARRMHRPEGASRLRTRTGGESPGVRQAFGACDPSFASCSLRARLVKAANPNGADGSSDSAFSRAACSIFRSNDSLSAWIETISCTGRV